MGEYMKDATSTMVELLGIDRRRPEFEAGRMAMGLEIVSVLRTIEGIPSVMSPAETATVVSVLETLLVQQGLTEAYQIYDMISAARRLSFLPVRADGAAYEDPYPTSGSDDHASPDGEPEDDLSPIDGMRQLMRARQSQDDSPNVLSGELIAEEDETTPSV